MSMLCTPPVEHVPLEPASVAGGAFIFVAELLAYLCMIQLCHVFFHDDSKKHIRNCGKVKII